MEDISNVNLGRTIEDKKRKQPSDKADGKQGRSKGEKEVGPGRINEEHKGERTGTHTGAAVSNDPDRRANEPHRQKLGGDQVGRDNTRMDCIKSPVDTSASSSLRGDKLGLPRQHMGQHETNLVGHLDTLKETNHGTLGPNLNRYDILDSTLSPTPPVVLGPGSLVTNTSEGMAQTKNARDWEEHVPPDPLANSQAMGLSEVEHLIMHENAHEEPGKGDFHDCVEMETLRD